MLKLNKIQPPKEYLDEWNSQYNDFVVLCDNNDIPLSNTLYRIGGMNRLNVEKDKYFMLLKYTEATHTYDFIKKCYPKLSRNEQDKHRKHLQSNWVIIDNLGVEKVVIPDSLNYGNLIDPQSCIYSIGNKYYNIETGFCYCQSYSKLIQSAKYVFLENNYDDDHSKRGVLQIDKITGTYILHTEK